MKRSIRLKPYLQNWRPLKIVYKIDGNDDIYQWEITDENGTVYIFGQPVRTSVSNTHDNGKTLDGTNGDWQTTTCYQTGGTSYECQVIRHEHYVNTSFNYRWYLTEIRSANYTTTTGEKITFSYTSPEATEVLISDLFCFAPDDDKSVTSIFKYNEGPNTHASFTFSYDNYNIFPVYPYEIESSSHKARFVMSSSNTPDKLIQGNKRIERIELYAKNGGSFNLASQLKFNYDAIGLAAGHPYSSGGNGRLQLKSILKLTSDGLTALPLVEFEYTSNPAWGGTNGYYYHDLFGYYSSVQLRRTGNNFSYPQGQSVVGTASAPGAEAWSVNKVIYGDGRIEEYEYAPNEITKISTGETIGTLAAPVLKPGIRVSKMKVLDGVTGSAVITNFEYSDGYMNHTYAVLPDLESVYTLLNTNAYRQIDNIMFLNSSNVIYGACKMSSSIAGSKKTYFLAPGQSVQIYESNPVTHLSLCDVYIGAGANACGTPAPGYNGVNSLAHYRGIPWKTEYYKQGTTTNPVKNVTVDYAIKYDLYSYMIPEVAANPAVNCPTGVGVPPSESPMPKQADNLNQTEFIGFIRQTSSIETNTGVTIRKDIISYNNENGLPNKIRLVGSDGKQQLSRLTFAIEEKNVDNSLVYQSMKDANILTPVSETVTFEKPNGSNDVGILPADVRKANVVIFSNTLGSGTWLPYKAFSWNVNMDHSSVPDPAKPFSHYLHYSGASNPNWQLTENVIKYT